MAILAISKLGNPILRQQAQSVSPSEIKKAAFQQLIDDMFETMYDEPGIGLHPRFVLRRDAGFCAVADLLPVRVRRGRRPDQPLSLADLRRVFADQVTTEVLRGLLDELVFAVGVRAHGKGRAAMARTLFMTASTRRE